MTPERLEYFSNFLFDMSDEDIETIREALKKADLDPEESKVNVLKKIEKAEIELRIAKGKKFKEDYLRTLGEIKFAETENEPVMPIGEFSFAFRKGDDGEDDIENMTEDEKKMQIIKKLTEKNKHNETPGSQ